MSGFTHKQPCTFTFTPMGGIIEHGREPEHLEETHEERTCKLSIDKAPVSCGAPTENLLAVR